VKDDAQRNAPKSAPPQKSDADADVLLDFFKKRFATEISEGASASAGGR